LIFVWALWGPAATGLGVTCPKIRRLGFECRKHTAYLCWPPPMVEAALKTLMRKRLFPKDIFREDFFDASDKATGGVRSPLLKG
jgi:hypothetical protein